MHHGSSPFSEKISFMQPTLDSSTATRPFFREGQLLAIPRRRSARLAVLNVLANQFEPGRRYTEKNVNSVLSRYHPDFCSLRRYLVDEQFLGRSDGMYWRVGGTFEVN
jgi:hypothetical protein